MSTTSITRRTKQLAATAVAAALGVTALAGCGSSDDSASGAERHEGLRVQDRDPGQP